MMIVRIQPKPRAIQCWSHDARWTTGCRTRDRSSAEASERRARGVVDYKACYCGANWQVYCEPVEIVPPHSAGNVGLRHGDPRYRYTGSSGRLSELQIQSLPPIGRA